MADLVHRINPGQPKLVFCGLTLEEAKDAISVGVEPHPGYKLCKPCDTNHGRALAEMIERFARDYR
jgi:hypothetical protein